MNLFLDCGSNTGQGFKSFSKRYGVTDYVYYLFEPNPFCFSKLEKNLSNLNYVKLHNNAVGVKDEDLIFFYKDHFDQGGTLVFEHGNSLFSNADSKSLTVKCINLDNYIQNIEKDFDKIVIKLDIESSEYDLLEQFIVSGTIKRFNKLYIEFHSQYMEGIVKEEFQTRETIIIDYMIENKIDYELWR